MSGIGNFDYQSVADTAGRATDNYQNQLNSFTKTMDSTNSADMVKLQAMTNQWSLAINLQSTMIKTIGDALKGVVQKIG
ncbi:hypothetical protein JMJ56_18525 [Belnapia sp. T18]|uniref:EscF/YscF/HrpA family type III secretion system needle major subunit n=1 Tax=Belnapia arida TaxID=2804533 RepID=A0ABS1U795_9PROT|nr:EscF/YscF/HrpA family type III secretion system needle major subunit [Belnapia arida]MBL6080020.1 hypothetical protein [Belnapia arida]